MIMGGRVCGEIGYQIQTALPQAPLFLGDLEIQPFGLLGLEQA